MVKGLETFRKAMAPYKEHFVIIGGTACDNGAFVADLTDYIKRSNIDYWIFGHSHRTLCDLIGHTQVLSNQLGYVARDEHLHGFDAGKYIEVG